MASLHTLQSHSLCVQPLLWSSKLRTPSHLVLLRPQFGSSSSLLNWTQLSSIPKLVLRATDASALSVDGNGSEDQNEASQRDQQTAIETRTEKLQSSVAASPPIALAVRGQVGFGVAIGFCVATAFLVLAVTVRVFIARKSNENRAGSVADLVRRGQLRSDRRGIARPLKYDDPFNNPLVKVGKSDSTVEMCGKVYRLAPVTLTEEQQAIHQKRRSRAYQWKRPTIFLKEGDSIPPDIDPDTVRWIPANHPFATTTTDIDEDLAQNNVRQKHGVPFRIQAEHEALQRKLQALQGDQKLNNLSIDPSNARDFERAFKLHPKSPDREEESAMNDHAGNSKSSSKEQQSNSSATTSKSEES